MCRSVSFRAAVALLLGLGLSSVGMLWAVTPGVSQSPSTGTTTDLSQLRGRAKVDALIDMVASRQQEVSSLRADFVQHKSSTLLLDDVEARGELRFLAPDRVRWDFTKPDPMVIVVADDMVTTFHPEARKAQRVKVSGQQSRLVGVFAGTQNLNEMRAQFRITLSDPGAPDPYRLTLDPIHRAIKKRLQSVSIQVDRQLMLPVVVEYHEPDGDTTRYEFNKLEINPELEEQAFRLELDSSVEVEDIDATAGSD